MNTPDASSRLLLVSNSTQYGSGYLDHCEAEIRDFLRSTARVLFLPFAMHDQEAYAVRTVARFEAMSYSLEVINEVPDVQAAVAQAQALPRAQQPVA